MNDLVKIGKWLWRVFDGNKSIICGYALALLGVDAVVDKFDPATLEIATDVVGWLAAGSLTLHGIKGKFGSGSN